jgi:hypothetical protein
MLEHSTLLLQPPDEASNQAVVDPSTGAPLGFAGRRPVGLWRQLFAARVLEVHEHEDASLLCIIRESWLGRVRVVDDADGRRIGVVRGRRLEDGYGRLVAVRGPDPAHDGDGFLDPMGRPLASLTPSKHGATLAFAEAIAADPFAKMLVLAAALRG